jgi:hypothetical protein
MAIQEYQCEFFCKQCHAQLVLLDYKMKCPKCGRLIENLPEDETLFIDNAIMSMQYYKNKNGSYRPSGTFVDSFAMIMFFDIYDFFDSLEQKQPADRIDFLNKYIDDFTIVLEEEEYLRQHYKHAFLSVLNVYNDQGFEKYLESKQLQLTDKQFQDQGYKQIIEEPNLKTKDDLIIALNDIIKENPLKFDQDYLDQLKIEITEFRPSSSGFIYVKYKIYNFDYCETFENNFSSNIKNAKTKAECIYHDIVEMSEPIKKDPQIRQLLKQAKKEADKIIKKERPFIYKLLPFIPYRRLRLCHRYWYETKRILKEKHGIDWKTPQERIPYKKFD